MSARHAKVAVVALASVAGCLGSASPNAVAPNAAAPPVPAKPGAFVDLVTPSRLVPDVAADRGIVATEHGYRRVLVDRMRLLDRDDGSIERAEELLPSGAVASVALPSRLGGGFLFHASAAMGTHLWRAPTWLAKLTPLTALNGQATEIVAGFDRLYVRFQSSSRIVAIDANTGVTMGLGPLPVAASYGGLAFADGWRAVVDTDLRGPLATFDAGTSWRSVELAERLTSVTVANGDPTILVGGGRYAIGAQGAVTYRANGANDVTFRPRDDEAAAARVASPFGKRPLRAAIEDGWPDSPATAVVARGGSLARVSLADGSVLAVAEDAYPDRLASCHAVRLGSGAGFVCGEREGATSLYELASPLAMRPVLRFAKPRFVAPSGNGAVVVRGGCTDAPLGADDARPYCIRGVDGTTREIRVKGDVGVERVVALADGRVAVLVPPRGGTGQLTILAGASSTTVALRLPATSNRVAHAVRTGMWLDGFEERERGVLTGWIEAGGPVVGVRITLDGKVAAGAMREESGGAILSGRFGLWLGEGGRTAESTDGGLHWIDVDLPSRDDSTARLGATRACGPAGCVLAGWMRVGWGKPATEDDLRTAAAPSAPFTPLKLPTSLQLQCDFVASAAAPVAMPEARNVAARAAPPRGRVVAMGKPAVLPGVSSGWDPFRNTPPPALAADEIGFGNGPYADLVQLYAYAWGTKGSDWSRAGRFRIRFDDRFDPTGAVHSSAVTASLWADEALAAEAVGSRTGGPITWTGYLDPSGRGLLAAACRGQLCSLYAVGEGQPVLPIRDAAGRSGTLSRPLTAQGAVRVGETWFFLTQGPSADPSVVSLWRMDLGVARSIATYTRSSRYGLEHPRMVRRALGGAVGLLVSGAPEPGERLGTWYVLPVDAETGELGEAVALVRRDLGGVPLSPCSAGQDGWLFDATIDTQTSIDLRSGGSTFDAVEMRLRLDPGSVCVEGIAGRVDLSAVKAGARPVRPVPSGAALDVPEGALSLAATERSSGQRHALACWRRRSGGSP